ncbi:hypothetical protein HOLleu_22845 [Holothuria leucospilota]|uniref:Uncharacterized protein n=1 Tax=Holothuria leucospilota TaxID=206669 RepID=A0A9Q1BUF2_HOLLE|nr:hypothetical protein HOLleu_22845 [Holothuria leucospilota]
MKVCILNPTVSNVYFNKTTKERTYGFEQTLNVTKWFDTGVELDWVTAKNAGKTVVSIMYVASWLPIYGVVLDRVIAMVRSWQNYGLRDRVGRNLAFTTSVLGSYGFCQKIKW